MSGFSIDWNADRSILEARVDGFWDQRTIARFADELGQAMADLRGRGVKFGVLGEGSGFAVQTQEVADGLTRLVDAGNQANRAPTAIVAGGMLVKMQAARAMAAPHLRVFATREEALAWLEEQLA